MSTESKFVTIPETIRIVEKDARRLLTEYQAAPNGLPDIMHIEPVVFGIEKVTLAWRDPYYRIVVTIADYAKFPEANRRDIRGPDLRWVWAVIESEILDDRTKPSVPSHENYDTDTLLHDRLRTLVSDLPVADPFPRGTAYLVWDKTNEKGLLTLDKDKHVYRGKEIVRRASFHSFATYFAAQRKLCRECAELPEDDRLRKLGYGKYLS